MKNLLSDISWLELFRVKVQEGFKDPGPKDPGNFLLFDSLVVS